MHLSNQASSLILDCTARGPSAIEEEVAHQRMPMGMRQVLALNPMLCGFEQAATTVAFDPEKLEDVYHDVYFSFPLCIAGGLGTSDTFPYSKSRSEHSQFCVQNAVGLPNSYLDPAVDLGK
jgi:hypothetical protein